MFFAFWDQQPAQQALARKAQEWRKKQITIAAYTFSKPHNPSLPRSINFTATMGDTIHDIVAAIHARMPTVECPIKVFTGKTNTELQLGDTSVVNEIFGGEILPGQSRTMLQLKLRVDAPATEQGSERGVGSLMKSAKGRIGGRKGREQDDRAASASSSSAVQEPETSTQDERPVSPPPPYSPPNFGATSGEKSRR